MRDERFASLAHPLRQRILLALLDHEPALNVPEDLGDGRDDLGALQDVLYHVHLPILAATGYVEWDRRGGVITRGSRFDEVEPLLCFIHRD